MTKLFKAIAAVAATLVMVVPAYADLLSPVGVWTTPKKESRYELTLCGDGDELCARLVWLREDAKTKKTLRYINENVIETMKRVGQQKWRGKVDLLGKVYHGSLEVIAANKIKVMGCQGPLCESLILTRYGD